MDTDTEVTLDNAGSILEKVHLLVVSKLKNPKPQFRNKSPLLQTIFKYVTYHFWNKPMYFPESGENTAGWSLTGKELKTWGLIWGGGVMVIAMSDMKAVIVLGLLSLVSN